MSTATQDCSFSIFNAVHKAFQEASIVNCYFHVSKGSEKAAGTLGCKAYADLFEKTLSAILIRESQCLIFWMKV